jgi:hypothetical protein
VLFFVVGILPKIFNEIGKYYHDELSGREHCNTGIAPCFIGFFEYVIIISIGFITSALIILTYLKKTKAKRKWFIFIMGFITLMFAIFISLAVSEYELSIFNTLPLLYLLSFGSMYLIFTRLPEKRSS